MKVHPNYTNPIKPPEPDFSFKYYIAACKVVYISYIALRVPSQVTLPSLLAIKKIYSIQAHLSAKEVLLNIARSR